MKSPGCRFLFSQDDWHSWHREMSDPPVLHLQAIVKAFDRKRCLTAVVSPLDDLAISRNRQLAEPDSGKEAATQVGTTGWTLTWLAWRSYTNMYVNKGASLKVIGFGD